MMRRIDLMAAFAEEKKEWKKNIPTMKTRNRFQTVAFGGHILGAFNVYS